MISMGPKPFRYMRADVMPLFAAVAVGIGAAGTIITRKLFAVRIPARLSNAISGCLALRQHHQSAGCIGRTLLDDMGLYVLKFNRVLITREVDRWGYSFHDHAPGNQSSFALRILRSQPGGQGGVTKFSQRRESSTGTVS